MSEVIPDRCYDCGGLKKPAAHEQAPCTCPKAKSAVAARFFGGGGDGSRSGNAPEPGDMPTPDFQAGERAVMAHPRTFGAHAGAVRAVDRTLRGAS